MKPRPGKRGLVSAPRAREGRGMHTGGEHRLFTRAAGAVIAAVLVLGSAPVAGAEGPLAQAQPAFNANFFGMAAGADLTQLSDADFTKEMNLMQQAGVHWLRIAIPWGRVHHVETYPD